MNSRGQTSQSGLSMVELMLAMAVVGVAVMMQVQQISIALREFHVDQDTQFADRKAAGMLAELQAAVDQGLIGTVTEMDALDDQQPQPLLTTRPVPAPDDFMSGNLRDANGQWIWWRDIDVETVAGATHSRYVRIRVYHQDLAGERQLVSFVSGLLNLAIRAEPTVQEYDVYALAIAEAPSLWLPLPELRAQLQSVVEQLGSANPNLAFRLHWITHFGYGRDPLYTPYCNATARADTAAPWAYWYPGMLATGSGASQLYAAELFGGRVRTEGGVLHGYDAAANPLPYAIADRFNHCMRAPAARALFDARVGAGLEKSDEPPLQLLLDDMARDPVRYQNAIVLNLHGDGLPFPPLRNYSDAAKDPEGHPGVRVVAHPSRLCTPTASGSPPVEFRVYAYKTDPTAGAAVLDVPITLQVFGGDFTGSIVVERQSGGIDPATGLTTTGTAGTYSFGAAKRTTDPHAAFEMNYEVGYSTVPSPHTWVRFHDTPLVCSPVNSAGLHSDAWLYGTDYVPSPVTSLGTGFYAMSNAGTTSTPKNTVRWRVQLPQAALAATFGTRATIQATVRIGTDMTTGTVWPTPHQPYNASTTWAWWSSDPEYVPVTERAQFQGDPRHNPYLDLCAQAAVDRRNGYNWWFDDLQCAASGSESIAPDWRPDWTCLDTARLRDHFGSGSTLDVPRAMQVWRRALQQSHAVLANPGGRLAAALLTGGEIALSPASIGSALRAVTVNGALYGATGTVTVDDIDVPTAPTAGRGEPVVRDATGFWSKPWLGELWRDVDFTAWLSNGNLATAEGWRRESRGSATLPGLPYATAWTTAGGNALGDLGGASLLQQSGTGGAFVQANAGLLGFGTLGDEVFGLTQRIGFTTARTAAARLPFTLTGTLSTALPQLAYTADYPAQQVSVLDVCATSSASGKTAAAVLRVGDPGLSSRHGYVAAMGETGGDPRDLMSRALAYALRGLFVAAEPGRSDQVSPLPRLEIEEPEPQRELGTADGVLLRWKTPFVRFDGDPYTNAFPGGWSGSENDLVYVVSWRRADEVGYRSIVDDAPLVAGVLPTASSAWIADAGTGSESLTLSLPTDRFLPGEIVLRVDCFRTTTGLHVAHHEVHVRR